MDRTYYAAQRPRGFQNETIVARFASTAERDNWIASHETNGSVNSATHGAFAISASRARYLVRPAEWLDSFDDSYAYTSRY